MAPNSMLLALLVGQAAGPGTSAGEPAARRAGGARGGEINAKAALGATSVVLDFRNQPLRDVVHAIGRRSGMTVKLVPGPEARGSTRRVTLVETAPTSFW